MSTTPAYCQQSDIELILTRYGLRAFFSRDMSAPIVAQRVIDSINRAGTKFEFYVLARYDDSELTGNDFARWAVALMATIQIVRRENAAQNGLQQEYDELIEQLKMIQLSQADLPRAVPRQEEGIWHSNLRHDQRYNEHQIRVSESTSSGDQRSSKPRFADPFDIFYEN